MNSGTESYYSFDYGNIHFLVLNSFDENRAVGSTMYNWALSDIQNTDQKWIVAIWHHPPYSKGWHTSEGTQGNGDPAEIQLIEMRQNFLPMLESNGVDLVVAGHSESYERSYLINGHYGVSDTFDEAIHTVGNTGVMEMEKQMVMVPIAKHLLVTMLEKELFMWLLLRHLK